MNENQIRLLPVAVNCGGKGGTKGPCPGPKKAKTAITKPKAATEKEPAKKKGPTKKDNDTTDKKEKKSAKSKPPKKVSEVEESGKKATSKLTPDETKAVVHYTASGYKDLNKSTRNCPTTLKCLSNEHKSMLNHIESAIEKSAPHKPPVTVYRGMSGPDSAKLLNALRGTQSSNRSFVLPSLTSSSTSPKVIQAFSGGSNPFSKGTLNFVISANRGLYVDHMSANKGEKEMILSKKARYRVVRIDGNTVHMEML